MEIRRSYDRLISTMGFPILVRQHPYIESGPRSSVARGMSTNPYVSSRLLVNLRNSHLHNCVNVISKELWGYSSCCIQANQSTQLLLNR